jgi:hypothetical protein
MRYLEIVLALAIDSFIIGLWQKSLDTTEITVIAATKHWPNSFATGLLSLLKLLGNVANLLTVPDVLITVRNVAKKLFGTDLR